MRLALSAEPVRVEGDRLGDGPVFAARAACEAATAAAASGIVAGQTVHLSFGDTPADAYAYQLAADPLLHGDPHDLGPPQRHHRPEVALAHRQRRAADQPRDPRPGLGNRVHLPGGGPPERVPVAGERHQPLRHRRPDPIAGGGVRLWEVDNRRRGHDGDLARTAAAAPAT